VANGNETQEAGIVIEPQVRVGPIEFRIDEKKLEQLMGPSIRKLPMSYDRYLFVYAGQIDTVVLHKQYGVVGVSISIAPVSIKGPIEGRNLLSMSGTELVDWLDDKAVAYTLSDSKSNAEFVDVEIPDWSVIVYLHNGQVDGVEAAFGTWKYGRLVEAFTDS